MNVSWILRELENISQKGTFTPTKKGHNRMFSAFGLFSAPALLCGDVKEVWWVGLWSIIRFVFNNHPLKWSRYVFSNHRICIHSTSLSSVFSLGLRTLRAFVHPKKFNNQHLMYSTVFNEHIKHSTIHSHSICSKDMEIHLQNMYDHRHRVSAVCVFFGRARLTLTPSAH